MTHRGNVKFKLHGQHLKGGWILVRARRDAARGRRNDWLLINRRAFRTTGRWRCVAKGRSLGGVRQADGQDCSWKGSFTKALHARRPFDVASRCGLGFQRSRRRERGGPHDHKERGLSGAGRSKGRKSPLGSGRSSKAEVSEARQMTLMVAYPAIAVARAPGMTLVAWPGPPYPAGTKAVARVTKPATQSSAAQTHSNSPGVGPSTTDSAYPDTVGHGTSGN
jgi:hypothetical protein